MNKIIFLSARYFSKVDFLRMSLDEYFKNKIAVEVWYLNKLRDANYKRTEFYFKSRKVKIKKIINYFHFEQLLKKNTLQSLYFLRITYDFKNKKIFQLLSKYDADFVFYLRSLTSLYGSETKLTDYLKYQSRKLFKGKFINIKKLINIKNVVLNKIFLSFNTNFWGIKKAKYVYMIGKYAYLNRKTPKLFGHKTRIIWGHLRNYDDFLREGNSMLPSRKKKALFIDQAVPFHPALLEQIGGISDVQPIQYYKSIRSFLIKLNEKFGYEIEISCHPRMNVNKLNKFFPDFKIEIRNTNKQVKRANLIIFHDSTVLNYAVLFNKPMIFITNNSLNNSSYPHYGGVKMVATFLNKKCFNIDENFSVNMLSNSRVNKRVYKKYLMNFIKYKGTKKFQSNLIIDKLKKEKFWT